MKRIIFTAITLLSMAPLVSHAMPSKHNPKVDINDYLRIEGTYLIDVLDASTDDAGTLKRTPFKAIDRLILLYDATNNTLIGSLTSAKTANPLILFDNLSTEYSDDHKKILMTGFGGGALHGELKLSVDISAGDIQGQFFDGINIGRKEISGTRKSSLFNFVTKGSALYSSDVPLEQIFGVYEGENQDPKSCGNRTRPCKVRLILRQFSDKTITAALTALNETPLTFTFSHGAYDSDLVLLEFTTPGSPMHPKLRTKVNVVALADNCLKIYLYSTNGNYSYYTLKKKSAVLR